MPTELLPRAIRPRGVRWPSYVSRARSAPTSSSYPAGGSRTVPAVLFVVQTYVAALLVPGQTEFAGEAATNDAFYTISGLVGGGAFKLVVAVSDPHMNRAPLRRILDRVVQQVPERVP